MSGIATIIDHIKTAFPKEFVEARYREAHEGFDLNNFKSTDLVIIPASLKNVVLGSPARAVGLDSIIISKSYIGIFSFSTPIKLDQTLRAIINQLLMTPILSVEVNRVELNPQIILKRILGNESADPKVNVFAIWFTVNEFVISSKENCGICYDVCD